MAANKQTKEEAIITHLSTAFVRVLPLSMLQNNRRKCFATIANYVSAKSGKKVSEVLNNDEIGTVIDNVEASHMNRVMGKVDF